MAAGQARLARLQRARRVPRRHGLCRGRRALPAGRCLDPLLCAARAPDRSAVLMNSPRQPDGPPIRDGKPYSALVHLAEDVTPFVAVVGRAQGTRAVGARGLCLRPRPAAFCVLEDLGDRVFGSEVARGRPLAELWGPAVDVLVALAGTARRTCLPIEGHAPYRLPVYDAEAMLDRGLAADRLVLAGAARATDAPPGLARRVRRPVAPTSRARRKRPIRAGCCATTTRPI